MSYTGTSTTAYTRTHTAAYLADVIMGSMADILGTLGIDATVLFAQWEQDAAAIAAWINEGSLSKVVLECHHPSGSSISPILEFPVEYRAGGEGDKAFTADRAALARYLAKIQRVPAGSTYRLFCTFNGWHSDQPGWSAATRASTAGMRANSFGTLASAPHAGAQLRYYTT